MIFNGFHVCVCAHHLRAHFPQFKSILVDPLLAGLSAQLQRYCYYGAFLSAHQFPFNLLNGPKIDLRIFFCASFYHRSSLKHLNTHTHTRFDFVSSFPKCTHQWAEFLFSAVILFFVPSMRFSSRLWLRFVAWFVQQFPSLSFRHRFRCFVSIFMFSRYAPSLIFFI